MDIKKYTLLIVTILLISCNSAKSKNTVSGANKKEISSEQQEILKIAQNVSAAEFKKLMDTDNYQLVDVRTPEEYQSGSIKNAQNINFLSDKFQANISQLDKSMPVLVFCQSGGRSSKAMKTLSENNFNIVYNLIGGYGQWPKP